MARLRLKQLAQDGATSGQVVSWDGSKWAPADASSGGAGGSPLYTLRGDGVFTTQTKVDAAVVVQSFTITAVKAYRGTAGSSSSTIIDVNKNGTTIFTTQANRPTFANTDGDNKIVTKTPDVVAMTAGDLLTFDIDQVEGGSPADLVVEIYGVAKTYEEPITEKTSQQIGEWLPASGNNVSIDTEGLYDLTDKVIYKRVIGNSASQQGGFAAGFVVPSGATGISAVVIEYKASTTSMTIQVDVIDTGGTVQAESGFAPGGTSKESHTYSSPAGTYTAGGIAFVLVKCSLDSSEQVSISRIRIQWTPTPTEIVYSLRDSHEVGAWLPASNNNVNIDSEGLYDLTDKVLYRRVVGNAASQQGGFSAGFEVPDGITSIASILVEYKASTTSMTIQLDLVDTDGAVQAESSFAPSTTSKETHTYSTPGGACDSGKTVYVLVKCSLDLNETVSLSKIRVTWA